jgi:hypothetical protein
LQFDQLSFVIPNYIARLMVMDPLYDLINSLMPLQDLVYIQYILLTTGKTKNVCVYVRLCLQLLACVMLQISDIAFSSLQIKLSSVQLAMKYMKRVASELDALSGPEKEPNREFLVLQGVRFAFRVHQVSHIIY